MNKEKYTASSDTNTPAANIEEYNMYISTLNKQLKTAVVSAAIDDKISYRTAYEIIQKQELVEI